MEREFSAASPGRDARGPLGDSGALKALVEEACALPSTAGAFVAVWKDGNLVCQKHAHLQRISSWTALATCRFIVRERLRRILVAPSGAGHVQSDHQDTNRPSPQRAKEMGPLAFRYIQCPFAAVTFRDRSQRLRGVLLVAYTDEAAPTKADLDALDRIAGQVFPHGGLSRPTATDGDDAAESAASVPLDPELTRLVDASDGTIGAWEMSTLSGRTMWSQAAREMLDAPSDHEFQMSDLLGLLPNESHERLDTALDDCRRKGTSFDETLFYPCEGAHKWIRVLGRPYTGADGTVDAVRGIIQKTSKAPPGEARQSSFARQLHDTLDNIPDALCLLDQQWRFTFVNQRCERMIGHTRMDLLGQVIWDAFPQLRRSALLCAHEDAVASQASRTLEVHLASISADFEIRVHPGRYGIMLSFQDITERKRKEREVEHLAQHDTLTGLPNRFALEQVLEQQRRHVAPWASGSYAVLFIDLDGFKDVNDTCGHVEADRVLIEVARRLQKAVRNQDTVARYGGDEFVVVLCGLSDSANAATAETKQVARKLLEAITTPIVVGSSTQRIGASIGATISRIGEGEAESLLRNADMAMYRAKRGQTGQIGIFDGDSNESVPLDGG
ncbi:diguanylate cyclase [Aquisalimonas lutea]|uniref:sensor domain-containing diguanylate cyclase n=1 Tax=Aquisalimonas lutea TaxID=1327750 RepID=UPI0025B4AF02|nr:sensor domain-containing diguanylate cyclase [Aquisalimonas lutea]MDN3517236.1 diguanylate cyclase [Aquisalimonas lutea]